MLRMGRREGLLLLEVVRVEVSVRVEVPCPGAVTVEVGAEEGEARREAQLDALPVGVGAAVVTSRYSTLSTRVVVGSVTLIKAM